MISLDLMKSSGIRKAGDRCVIPSNDKSTVHIFFSIDIKKLDRYTLKILFIFIEKWVSRLNMYTPNFFNYSVLF